MTPKVDKEKCIGCGACVAVAANTFKMGDDGKSEVVNPTGDTQEVIQQAVDGCPVQAIILE
jgi:ferredoxin